MAIEISREQRQEAIASIERYFRENMEEKIGNIAAGALLGYFLEELGPHRPLMKPSGGKSGDSDQHARTFPVIVPPARAPLCSS